MLPECGLGPRGIQPLTERAKGIVHGHELSKN